MLSELCDIGTIQNGNRQRDSPNPKHLKDPEAKKGEKLVALVIKTIVFASLEDAEQQKTGKPERPYYDEERGDDLAGMLVSAEGEGEDGEDSKVGPAGEICQLVEFEGEGDGEEEQLVDDGNDGRDD